MLKLTSWKKKNLKGFIAANYESEIASMYLRLMVRAGIFWIPPWIQVIIEISVVLFRTAHIAADFHNADD